MKRRDFITLLGGAAAVWPLVARAQQPAMPVVGFLGAGSAQSYVARLAGFRQGLQETGYREGQNVAFEYRWAEDQMDKLPVLATDLVRRQVEVIIVLGATAAALAAKSATSTIPIIFSIGGDPVRAGLVASLARPGGNVTGVASLTEVLITKRFEIVRELVPNAAVIAFLFNPDNPNVGIRVTDVQAAARSIGQQIRILNAKSEAQFETIFATLVQEKIGALVVQNDALFVNRRARLAARAVQHSIPTIYEYREFVAAGGLISYGSSDVDNIRQVGIYTGRILKGAKPADLPVMLPTKFELVVNLKAAKAIGLVVPETFLVRADEVIE